MVSAEIPSAFADGAADEDDVGMYSRDDSMLDLPVSLPTPHSPLPSPYPRLPTPVSLLPYSLLPLLPYPPPPTPLLPYSHPECLGCLSARAGGVPR